MRSRYKKLAGRNKVNLIKKKNKTTTQKKYKMFKNKIRPFHSITAAGDGIPNIGQVGFRCLKACKLNYSTMIGIQKKANILKKRIKVWFRKYPAFQLTRKSTGHRMGKGKGKFSARIAKYKKGEIILELSHLDRGIYDNYYKAIIKTLPIKVETVLQSSAFHKATIDSYNNIKHFKREYRLRKFR
jgi:ribosomal protein L16/L10AE